MAGPFLIGDTLEKTPTLNEIYDKLIESGDYPLFGALWKSFNEKTGLEGWLKNIPDEQLIPLYKDAEFWLDLDRENTKEEDNSDFFMAAFNSIYMYKGDFSKKIHYKKIFEQGRRIMSLLLAEILVRFGVADARYPKDPYDLKKTGVTTKELTLDCINAKFVSNSKDLPLTQILVSTYKNGKFLRYFLNKISDKLLIDTLSECHLRKKKDTQYSLDLQFTLMIFHLLQEKEKGKESKIDDSVQAFWAYAHLEFAIRNGAKVKEFPTDKWSCSVGLESICSDFLKSDFVLKNNAEALAKKINDHFGLPLKK